MSDERHDGNLEEEKRSPLARRDDEPVNHHRALLIYAMQSPRQRSYRATGRAVRVSDGSIRTWAKRGLWNERVTKNCWPIALSMYRRLYLASWGSRELDIIEANMDQPPLASEARRAAVKGGEVDKAVGEVRKEERKQAAGITPDSSAKFIPLVDALLGKLAGSLRAEQDARKRAEANGDDPLAIEYVKVSVRDLPSLIKCRAMLAEEITPDGVAGVAPAESVRVRQAKKSGGDVIEALLEDAREMVVIFEALDAGKKRDERAEKGGNLVVVGGGNDIDEDGV